MGIEAESKRLVKGMEELERFTYAARNLITRLTQDRAGLRAFVLRLADRIHAAHEVIGRRAEKGRPVPRYYDPTETHTAME